MLRAQRVGVGQGNNIRKSLHPRISASLKESTGRGSDPLRSRARMYHTSLPLRQQAEATIATGDAHEIPPFIIDTGRAPKIRKPDRESGIRAQLRRWQELHADDDLAPELELASDPITNDGVTNSFSRLPDQQAFHTTEDEQEDQRQMFAAFMSSPRDEPGSNAVEARTHFLRMGDLVELEYLRSERESVVAVFIRRIGPTAQLYTMQGRWVHISERTVQYSIPGWVDPALITPLLEHLPDATDIEENYDSLMEDASVNDLSVPRHVAAPLVSRMVQFHTESQEIYRRHASTLDNAHNILAHEDKLRFTNLVSMATKLLNLPADKLPLTALFAVRQALSHAGFAFSIDRRSHRLTGHVTVRTREQVRMAEKVKRWLHEWQDDLADRATMSEAQLKRHRPSRGAQYVYSFISKAKHLVQKSRRDRQPTAFGCVGPSQVRLPITPEKDCVRSVSGTGFDEQDQELIKFMEAWALSNMFVGLPRVESLPPLILQATGLYTNFGLDFPTGMQFLQELGTISPYENRVRYDQHLLLPQSEHSKPLQDLMNRVLKLQARPGFEDSMKHLRRDWKDLPVYCIDDASAHEIDDGLSIEPLGHVEKEGEQWWVHIHIANPTAFFSRDHDLAKMSQHMHESVYMPERAYMMMPRWATQGHFSLAPNRPCLTFSARMDTNGKILENKIQPGIIRNVFRLTPDEMSDIMGTQAGDGLPETVLTVGGAPPPPPPRTSRVKDITAQQVQQLKSLVHLAQKRLDIRKAAGGLFFQSSKNPITIWESHKRPGLPWSQPSRTISRHTEGDPILQMRTKGLTNWFAAVDGGVDVLVREMMLLACEVAATWCAVRAIPAVFRGSVPNPDTMDSERFFREIVTPAVRNSPTGEVPMHLGLQYLQTFGSTALSTKPFKHKILGMEQYGKVTSPLRRYSDMIIHWQIEGALRQESKTGKSLIVPPTSSIAKKQNRGEEPERHFLPFSIHTLRNLFRIMQPRESMISKAKGYAEDHWRALLLFRAFHFGEAELPFYRQHPTDPSKTTVRAFVSSASRGIQRRSHVAVICQELNFHAQMIRPERIRDEPALKGLPEPKMGDVWECEIVGIDVYMRGMQLKPLGLLERVEEVAFSK